MVPRAVQDDGRGAYDATRTARPSAAAIGPTPPVPAASTLAPLKYRERERYEIRGEQGRGGLGLVWRAHDRELGRDVAVKELLARGNTSELRFLREALITSRLEHPGIVPVHEAGRWSDGTPFYTMKLVGGRSLHDRIAEQHTLEGRLALLPNIISVADAIAYAHECGVIHRDLKPSNVMVGDFGETIVIDWGLAKVLDDTTEEGGDQFAYRTSARPDLTAAGSVLGTPAYMAPEQYRGRSDARTDVYALGGILHHVLTGKAPHERTASLEFSPPLLRYARNTPEDLIAIVQRALGDDPAKRYQTARAFGEDLKRYIRRERVDARRYSLASRVALAFARHRTVALVLMAALAALTITFGVALINIRKERADAVAASKQAVINSAAAMLERDPTRASEVLASLDPRETPALLRARIQAAGLADRRVALPGRFEQEQVLHSGDRVVISTGERALLVLNTKTGTLVRIADGLTAASMWAATEERVYFVRNTSHLVMSEVSLDGGAVKDIASLDASPPYMFANDSGVFWLSAGGVVESAGPDRPRHVVVRDVDAFEVFGGQIVVCTAANTLQMGRIDEPLENIGTCPPESRGWNTTRDGFVYAGRDATYAYQHGQLHVISAKALDLTGQPMLTETGLVTAIGKEGDGLLLRNGDTSAEHVVLSDTPVFVSAYGDVAAWAFADGTVELVDATDGRHWSIHATVGRPMCLDMLSADHVMTCDRDEVRVWALPKNAPVLIPIAGVANNAAFNANGTAILDGLDGHGYLLDAGKRTAVSIQNHQATSFGAAWCDGEACTAGWDGRVLCTNLSTGITRVAADVHAMTPWLASGGGHCFTAAASGAVFDLRSPAAPAYSHDHEPYRLAVSDDGRYEASGDWGGDLIVYDAELQRVVGTSHPAHEGRVTDVAWLGHRLVSAGTDGMLRIWSTGLQEQTSWHTKGAIRYMVAAGDTIGMAFDDGTLAMLSATAGLLQRTDVGVRLTALAIAPAGQFVAAGTNDGEIVVLSTDRRAAAMRATKGHVSCLAFDSAASLVACTEHAVMRIPISAFSFQTN